jgi:hypothetical protein
MILFASTRLVQLVWVFGSLAAIWGKENFDTWIAAIQIPLSILFTSLQLYTLFIYSDLFRKLAERRNTISPNSDETAENGRSLRSGMEDTQSDNIE